MNMSKQEDVDKENNEEDLLGIIDEVELGDLLASDTPLRFDTSQILKKLDEIEKLIKNALQVAHNNISNSVPSLCERILEKGYVVEDTNKRISNQSIYVIELSDGKAIYTFRDTIELLTKYFDEIKEEDEVEVKLPRRLLPLFQLLRRYGLIYFEYSEKRFRKVF